MRRIVLFCALGLLGGCRTAEPLTNEVITLFCSTSEPSKTAALSAGDAVGVFAALEGSEDYFVENAKWVVGSDGHTLTTTPAAYYPQERQAIRFYAYLPLGGTWSGARGSFSVPTDQSTAAALKQADLCWATASSTPVATPVSLEFEHLMARLVVQANQTPTQLTVPNAVTGGVLHVTTGALVLGTTRSELNTTGSELILPAQPLTRLLLTVSGIVYVYEGAIPLEAGKTTTLNLTLNPSTKTATLAGSSVTPWLATTATGNPTPAVANTLTLHWPKSHPKSSFVDKIILTIKDEVTGTTAEYTVSTGITYANNTFTIPLLSSSLHYPYTVTNIQLYQSLKWVHGSTKIRGATIEKIGSRVMGVTQPLNPPSSSDYIKIGTLYWTKGFLIGVNNNECKAGASTDGGIYFQCGSLIGWKGGNQANGGNGRGMPQSPLTTNGTFWNGVEFSWADDVYVWPTEIIGTRPVWSGLVAYGKTTLTEYFFNYSAGTWSGTSVDFRFFDDLPGGTGNLSSGRYAHLGVGDPCTYYLGDPWRLPTTNEAASLVGRTGYVEVSYNDPTATIRWVPEGKQLAGIDGPGVWMGADMNLYCIPDVTRHLFQPASGQRSEANGSFHNIKTETRTMGTNIHWMQYYMGNFFVNYVAAVGASSLRSNAWPLRCVSE